MKAERNNFWINVYIVIALVAVLWVSFLLQHFGYADTFAYGILAKQPIGLRGIIFSPFIHGNLEHLVSNSLPVMVLLMVLLNAYPECRWRVLLFIHLVSGALVWCFSPLGSNHIGISGIIYGIAAFLIASGFMRQHRNHIAIAIFVALSYGGMVIGFIPVEGVSWQSHVFGAWSGALAAWLFRNYDLPELYEPFAGETPDSDRHFFEEVNNE